MKKFFNYVTIALVAFNFVACGDDDPAPVNEEEVITTVKLSVQEAGAPSATEYTWTEDSQDDITLNANSSYNIKIQFLDESNPDDVEDITAEVIEEKDEHYVFYQTTAGNLTFTNASDDTIDSDSVGINISTDWTTGAASSGIIKAFLIHEPTTKDGTERDDFGGETDIEVDFNVSIVVPVSYTHLTLPTIA